MKNPLVSIIIPTYNRAEKISDCIESVINQIHKNIEILIVDDGSKDNTKNIIKKYKDSRIKYFYKTNSGPSDSRNYGLKKAKGEYISFIDDDDIYLPNKIDTEVSFLRKHKNYDFCYSNMYVICKNKSSLSLKEKKINSYLNLLLDGTGSFISTQTVMLKRKVIKKVGYFNKIIEPVEDYDYWLRCAEKFNFGYIDKPLAIYKLHDSNITKGHHKILKWMSVVRLMHLKKLNRSDIQSEYRKKYEWELNFHQGRVLYYKNKYKKANPYFIKAIKSDWRKITAYIFLLQSLIGGELLVKTAYKIYMDIKFR